MQDFINKEIDMWLTTSRSVGISEQEANLRAMLERAYEAGQNEADWLGENLIDAHKKGYEAAFEKVRVSLLAFINNNLKQ